MTAGARALVLAGRGRYADPWHDHAATSVSIARSIEDLGASAVVRSTFADAFEDLSAFDLVVVNAGRGRTDAAFDGDDAAWLDAHRSLRDYVAGGGALLAVHQAANTFSDSPWWPDVLGGRWVPGTSMHPERRVFAVTVVDDHPVVEGLGPQEVFDEQYCHLEVRPSSHVLAWQTHDGQAHPVIWRSQGGPGRVLYDALGHDVAAYARAGRQRLLRRELAWLLSRHGDRTRPASPVPGPSHDDVQDDRTQPSTTTGA